MLVAMEVKMLGDPEVFPDNKILKGAMGESYPVFDELMTSIKSGGLSPEWRYYRDGKSWLCKVVSGKKTIFWLSVWDGSFKTAFYFLERYIPGLMELDINENLKSGLFGQKSIGKLLPLVVEMRSSDQLKDILEVIRYKKSLK
jgi:hypothetical protein